MKRLTAVRPLDLPLLTTPNGNLSGVSAVWWSANTHGMQNLAVFLLE